ncbi:MAG: CRR6 family NdhI maturation factor [Microcystaceae cyanobacterium]
MNNPSKEQPITINLNANQLHQLDLSPIKQWLEPILAENKIVNYEQKVQLKIDYPRQETDPRELSEIPEIRLWFVRLDTVYPWFPFVLDWKAGELGRYTAMLVPHQFHRTEGVQYNPEALELFLMKKIFVLSDWFREHDISGFIRLKGIAQLLGYDLDDDFLSFLATSC